MKLSGILFLVTMVYVWKFGDVWLSLACIHSYLYCVANTRAIDPPICASEYVELDPWDNTGATELLVVHKEAISYFDWVHTEITQGGMTKW